jgi:hypothetical protein
MVTGTPALGPNIAYRFLRSQRGRATQRGNPEEALSQQPFFRNI